MGVITFGLPMQPSKIGKGMKLTGKTQVCILQRQKKITRDHLNKNTKHCWVRVTITLTRYENLETLSLITTWYQSKHPKFHIRFLNS